MKRNKYGAIRTTVDGHTFHSKREAARYGELKLLERAGRIRTLRLQPRFPLIVEGMMICTYVADFQYNEKVGEKWNFVVEDVKGIRTSTYKIKRALLLAKRRIKIRET